MFKGIVWNNTTKEVIQYVVAVGCIWFGCIMVIFGFFTEPIGEVADSVLYILAQMLVFAGSIMGISLHYSNELDKIKTQIKSFNNKDNTSAK